MTVRSLVLLFLVVVITRNAAGMQDSIAVSTPDTTQADSLKSFFIPGMGEWSSRHDTTETHFTRFLWTDARTLADLYRYQPGVLLRSQGTPGQPNQLVIGGVDWRGISFLMDGRPLRDPVTGTMNLHEIPIEFVDHVESRDFEKSFAAGQDASAATLNIVTREYNTGRPITKIRFMQGPYEHLLTDAFFTQNIARRVNVLVGVQRHVSESRFLNSAYDSWNVRTRLRYNVSDRLNFSLLDLYRRSVIGMNGGIDIDSTKALGLDEFNDAEAIVLSEGTSETRTRRDLTLSAVALLLADSTEPTRVQVYFSSADRDFTRAGTADPFDRYAFEIHGVSLHQILRAGILAGRFGAQAERSIAGIGPAGTRDATMAAWNAEITADAGFLRPTVLLRGERDGDVRGFSWGLSSDLVPWAGTSVSGGLSSFFRFPNLQERNWAVYRFQGSGNLVEKHEKVHIGFDVRHPAVEVHANLSRQKIRNALVFKIAPPAAKTPSAFLDVIPTLTLDQFSGSLTVRLLDMEATGGLTWTESREGDMLSSGFPRFILTGELSYRTVFFQGALDAKFALQSRFVGRHTAVQFLPGDGIYAERPGRSLKPFSTFDLFGVFHVGDAFITLTWENPIDRQFMTVYPYPALGRNLKVGINWIFLD